MRQYFTLALLFMGSLAATNVSAQQIYFEDFVGNNPQVFMNTNNVNSGTTFDNSWVINTIDVPLMVRYSISDRLHVGGGPILSYISSAKQERVATIEGKELTVTEDIQDYFNTFQYGLAANLCYSLSKARKGKGIDLRLRYNYMFSSLLKENTLNNANLGNFQVIATFPFIL